MHLFLLNLAMNLIFYFPCKTVQIHQVEQNDVFMSDVVDLLTERYWKCRSLQCNEVITINTALVQIITIIDKISSTWGGTEGFSKKCGSKIKLSYHCIRL